MHLTPSFVSSEHRLPILSENIGEATPPQSKNQTQTFTFLSTHQKRVLTSPPKRTSIFDTEETEFGNLNKYQNTHRTNSYNFFEEPMETTPKSDFIETKRITTDFTIKEKPSEEIDSRQDIEKQSQTTYSQKETARFNDAEQSNQFFKQISPQNPDLPNLKSPDVYLTNLIRTFKHQKSIPSSMIENLTLEGRRIIVEKLISEKLSMQEQLMGQERRRFSIVSQIDEEFRGALSRQPARPANPSMLKLYALRGISNVSPIEKDESEIDINSKIASPLTPKDEINSKKVEIQLKEFTQLETELVRLSQELQELKSHNNLLQNILSYTKENDFKAISEIIKNKVSSYEQMIKNLNEERIMLKTKLRIGDRSFAQLDKREELNALWDIVGVDKDCGLKPSEIDTINKLIELSASGPMGKFDDYVNDLLSGHDIAEMASLLVRYIKCLEEDVCIGLRKQLLDLRLTNLSHDLKVEQAFDEKGTFEQQFQLIKEKMDSINYRHSRVNKEKQIQLREQDSKLKRSKWIIPDKWAGLSPTELYSKSIKKNCKLKIS
ncbi:unnamed protein product [Blepharisma stoltei]|uniref:Uncharacterized protein n=1 Tax=Blepharisma stoltei TaxID=1481888 RepID=A0AAU9J186_9CILI|nr:unnamed protein product [Blepharisma stoltei]